ASLAPVVDARAVAKEGGDVLRIVLATLVARARLADPAAGAVYVRAGAREHRRQLGMEDPSTGADRAGVGTVLEQYADHLDVRMRDGLPQRARGVQDGSCRARQQQPQR